MYKQTGDWSFLKKDAELIITSLIKEGKKARIGEVAQILIQNYELNVGVEELSKELLILLTNQEPKASEVVLTNSHKAETEVKITHKVENPKAFTTPGLYLCLGCIHALGHNVRLIDGITRLLGDKREQVVGLVLMGDVVDCNTLSEYDRGKFTALPGLTLEEEYSAGREVIKQLVEELRPDAHKVYLYGNHEDRYNRYMANMEDAKRPLQSPEVGMELDKMGFFVYNQWKHDYVTLGSHLDICHGQYFNVHCAKKHIDNFRGSMMFVHTHRVQTYIEGSVGGFNIGWGGDINSPLFHYMDRGTKKQWQNGFATVQVDEEGDYHVTQVTCHNNKFYYGGKRYA